MATTASPAAPLPPPPPVQPLEYPIIFASAAHVDACAAADGDDNETEGAICDRVTNETQPHDGSLQDPGDRAARGAHAPSSSAALRHSAALNSHTVTLFNALHWLRVVFEQARWMTPSEYANTCTYEQAQLTRVDVNSSTDRSNHADANANGGESDTSAAQSAQATRIVYEDVQAARQLLPRFDRFFALTETIIPKHSAPYVTVESFTLPTPKGPKTITRSKVEGDHRARHSQPVHAPDKSALSQSSGTLGATLTKTTVTNSSAYFSLLPGHNQFLLYYEDVCKLRYFTYIELDKLRFAWVAMRELFDESKVFHRSDGSLTGFAKRDLRCNNANSPFALALDETGSVGNNDNNTQSKSKQKNVCLDHNASSGGSKVVTCDASRPAPMSSSSSNTRGAGVEGDVRGQATSRPATNSKPAVGRGGGNARLHQGTSGNVITGPSKEALELRREAAQKRFMKQQLEEECTRRWPHTPPHKSCIYVIESKQECELPEEVVAQLALRQSNARNRNNTVRKGPRYYFATVELPLLNKKGNVARFRAARWCTSQVDAEHAAAEAALLALPTFKTLS